MLWALGFKLFAPTEQFPFVHFLYSGFFHRRFCVCVESVLLLFNT